jgi:hypothetical protein
LRVADLEAERNVDVVLAERQLHLLDAARI